ncbi:MAG TPA: hypothetical protein PLB51_01140 [Candidatus Paceibacterota bacterium]|nr:hypothetical protein [Candidatus Paceibacterota bacterium]
MHRTDIFEEVTFYCRGIALKAHPNRKKRILHLFEDHYLRLNPRYDQKNKKHVYLSWEYMAGKKDDALWEILLALDVCSFTREHHFEVVIDGGRTLNPIILDQQTYLTHLYYVTPFVAHYIPRYMPYKVLHH